jgi:hypothetical protein
LSLPSQNGNLAFQIGVFYPDMKNAGICVDNPKPLISGDFRIWMKIIC